MLTTQQPKTNTDWNECDHAAQTLWGATTVPNWLPPPPGRESSIASVLSSKNSGTESTRCTYMDGTDHEKRRTEHAPEDPSLPVPRTPVGEQQPLDDESQHPAAQSRCHPAQCAASTHGIATFKLNTTTHGLGNLASQTYLSSQAPERDRRAQLPRPSPVWSGVPHKDDSWCCGRSHRSFHLSSRAIQEARSE